MKTNRNQSLTIALFTILLIAGIASGAHIKLCVLNGQSDSLGTTNGSETDKSPGSDPADAQIRF